MAIKHRHPSAVLIYYSDRSSQYTGLAYCNLLAQQHIRMSMSKIGSCFDHAVAEGFFSTLKYEWLHHQRFATRQVARMVIFYFIEVLYNCRRLHSTLNYVSPLAFVNTYINHKESILTDYPLFLGHAIINSTVILARSVTKPLS